MYRTRISCSNHCIKRRQGSSKKEDYINIDYQSNNKFPLGESKLEEVEGGDECDVDCDYGDDYFFVGGGYGCFLDGYVEC